MPTTEVAAKDPQWSFLIGKCFVTIDSSTTGNGLSIASTFNFSPFFGVGAVFTEYKTKTSSSADWAMQGSVEFLNIFTEITPIHYQFNQMKFLGGLQLGATNSNSASSIEDGSVSVVGFQYGASASLNIENQIGI